jgi:kinesin family protein 18/19
MITVF